MGIIVPKTRVRINGATVPEVSRWTVSQQAGALPKRFSMQIQGPPTAQSGEVQIDASYEPADWVPIIEQAQIQNTAGNFSRDGYTTVLSGTDGAETIIRRSPENRIVFLAKEYVDAHAKGYDWEHDPDTGQVTAKYEWRGRIFRWALRIPEIPDAKDDQEAGRFESHIIQNDVMEVLELLGAMVGVDIYNNCPRTPFRNAYVLSTNRTYFDAVRDLVAIWNPLLTMHYDGAKWRLFILDVEGGQTSPTGAVTLEQDQLTVSNIRSQKEAIVNRATIRGAQTGRQWPYIAIEAPYRQRKPLEISPSERVERVVETDPSESNPIPSMPSWTEHHKTRMVKEYARDPGDINNRILLREEVTVYAWDGQSAPVLAKKVTTWDYLDYTAAIAENVEEYQRIILPGETVPRLRKIKSTKTRFGDYVDLAGEIESTSVEEGYVIFDYYRSPGGAPQYTNPQEARIALANNTVDLSAQSNQSYIWGQLRRRQVRYEVEDAQRVRRDTTVFHNLDGTVELESEYIPIDYENRGSARNMENRTRWDFEDEDSIAQYGHRPLVELSYPDLKKGEDDELANEIWERIKRKSNSELTTAQVGVPAWLPVLVWEKVTVKDVTLKRWDRAGNTYSDAVLPGGDYYATGVRHEFRIDTRTGEASLTTVLTLRSAY